MASAIKSQDVLDWLDHHLQYVDQIMLTSNHVYYGHACKLLSKEKLLEHNLSGKKEEDGTIYIYHRTIQ